MRKTVLILSNKPNETLWSTEYYKKHYKENVIILTSNIESQLLLKKQGIPFLKIFEVESYDKNKDNFPTLDPNSNIYKKSFETIETLIQQSEKLNLKINNINIIKLLANNLAFIYPDIFHSHNTYKKIISKWSPNKIFISENVKEKYVTGHKDDLFSLACYIKYYFSNSKIKIMSYSPLNNQSDHKPINLKIWIEAAWLILNKYSYLIVNFLNVKKEKYKKNKTIIMQTGGIITSYYYNLYKKLSENYRFNLITYKLQLKQQLPLIKRGVDYKEFDSFNNDYIDSQIIKIKDILDIEIDKLSIKSTHTKDQNLNNALATQTKLFLKLNLEQTIRKVLIQQKILDIFKPNLTLNSHDPSLYGASLVLQAKQKKIPTVLLLHGLYTESYLINPYSEYFAVWGKHTQKYFSKLTPRNPKTIIPVGFPTFDEYCKKSKIDLKRNINYQKGQKLRIGLLLNSYFPNDSYQSKFFFELFNVIKSVNAPLIINYRFHEGFDTEGIKALASELNIQVNDQTDIDFNKFIENNDIFISWETSALLWLMVYQKPIVYTSPIWQKGIMSQVYKYHAAWCPENPKQFIKILKRFIDNPKCYKELSKGQLEFVKDVTGPLDGKSTQRLTKLINKLIDTK